jgi:hypothetical protein
MTLTCPAASLSARSECALVRQVFSTSQNSTPSVPVTAAMTSQKNSVDRPQSPLRGVSAAIAACWRARFFERDARSIS